MIRLKVNITVDNVEEKLYECDHEETITFKQFVNLEKGLREAGYLYSTNDEKVVMHQYTPYDKDPTIVAHVSFSFEEV